MSDSTGNAHIPDGAQTRTPQGAHFVTTRWTVVLNAGRQDTPSALEALTRLCETYWFPLYAYVRRRGFTTHDAQDLTQSFFARLLEKNSLADLTRDGGKFRSFLLTSLNHFLSDEWRKAQAQKRGAGQVVSWDARQAETRYGREPADMLTPEKVYEQQWALTLLEKVCEQLHAEYVATGKGELFESLKTCLPGSQKTVPYAELSVRLNVTEGTLKVMVHRLRKRYRQLLRAEVAHTVANPAEVEEELRYLLSALAS